MKKITFLFVVFLSTLSLITLSQAADNKDTTSKDTKSKNGCDESISNAKSSVIASIGSYGAGGYAIDGDTSDSAPGEKASHITASIKTVSDSKCESIITNSSKCIKYSVSLAIKEGKAGSKPTTKTTNTLKLSPGEKTTLSYSCQKTSNYQVEILSMTGTKISK